MKLAAYLAVLSVASFSSAFADEPQSPAAQPATAAQPPAPNAPAAAAAANPSTTAKPAAAESTATPAKVDKSEVVNVAATEAEIKQMRGRGYKPVNRNGTLVFCRDEGELGTHFVRARCSTIDQLKQAELSGKDYTNQLQQQGSPTQFKGDMPPSGHP
jgi:hypothetical protein